MGDGLRICCYQIVLFVAEIDVTGLEGREDGLDEVEGPIRSAMLDQTLFPQIAGPWRECMEMIWTSDGRCASNA